MYFEKQQFNVQFSHAVIILHTPLQLPYYMAKLCIKLQFCRKYCHLNKCAYMLPYMMTDYHPGITGITNYSHMLLRLNKFKKYADTHSYVRP